ncbi:MAG: hypothetical protein ACM65L_26510 [Microcoleus sp.]
MLPVYTDICTDKGGNGWSVKGYILNILSVVQCQPHPTGLFSHCQVRSLRI